MMPTMVLRHDEAESQQLVESQLRATLNIIPTYTRYALPSGGLTFVNERTEDYLVFPKTIPSALVSILAQHGIRISLFCIRTITESGRTASERAWLGK